MLLLCMFIFLGEANLLPRWLYIAYLGVIAVDIIFSPFALSRYRYQKSSNLVSSD